LAETAHMVEVSSFFILWSNSRRSNDSSGFGSCTMCFVTSCSTLCSLLAENEPYSTEPVPQRTNAISGLMAMLRHRVRPCLTVHTRMIERIRYWFKYCSEQRRGSAHHRLAADRLAVTIARLDMYVSPMMLHGVAQVSRTILFIADPFGRKLRSSVRNDSSCF
jgi:hypothetical protein